MSDNRLPIPKGTRIEYCNENQNIVFTVSGTAGRGGSCIVYNAFYTDDFGIRHDCILKQLDPVRTDSESLIKWDNAEISQTELERFLKAARIQKNVGQRSETINSTSRIRSVFSYKDSVYFQFVEKNYGDTLDKAHFDTLHEYISVLIQIVKIISEYHSMGYLHLDIKPQNIFCKNNGNNKYTVSMFDFDSLINFSDVNDSSIVLSCSRGYASPELLHAKRDKIGVSSDFYEISCMLFEKIFGRFPKSTEISGFSRYKFNESILENCKNLELLSSLQDFFRHTLTVNINSRYKSDKDFISALDSLYLLSVEYNRYIISNFTTPATFFTGRKKEINDIRQILSEKRCVIIQGVGGIGKSSLALHYADTYRNNYSTIVYLEFHDSFEDLINTDIQINGISEKLSAKEKMEVFKELCNCDTLVILDNLDCVDYKELDSDWFSLPCHLIITSRGSLDKYSSITVPLSGLNETQELFYHYYTLPCNQSEKETVNKLLYTIDSHTMMTELLGKFCYNYRITHNKSNFDEVYDSFRSLNTDNAGNNSVKQVKDWMPGNRSIQKHMDILFSVFSFDDNEKYILNFLALIPLKSVSEKLLEKWCFNCSSSSLSRLISIGVIQFHSNGSYKIHPLIADRVLFNFPPKAENFAVTTEKIADSLSVSTNINRKKLLKISEHYVRHICGTHRSLAALYQTMVSDLPKNKQHMFSDKAVHMFSETGNGVIPYFFELKSIAEKYTELSWFMENEAEHKETLIDDFVLLCDTAIDNLPEYRIVQNCEQISKLCHLLAQQDIMCTGTKKEEQFFIYQVKFLEKAFESCSSENDKKRVATELFDCYNSVCSPVENAVKAEEYSAIADVGVKFYDSVTHDRIETSEQERAAEMIDAMRTENQKENCLIVADKWYEKHINGKLPLYHYLRFLMELIYEENEQWEKYIELVEEEMNDENNVFLEIGKAYYHLGNYEKSNEYLLNAAEYYSKDYNSTLNYETENYLLSLGLLAANNMDKKEGTDYEEIFFSAAEKYFGNSLMKKADELATFCLSMCRNCLKNNFISEGIRFLKLYTRFRDTLYVTEEEYSDFEVFLIYCDNSEKNYFWIKLYMADYLENHDDSPEALNIYNSILESLVDNNASSHITEFYRQIVYYKTEYCDYEYFIKNFSSKINYEIIYDIEMQGTDKIMNFDSIVHKKLEIVRNYKKVNSVRSEIVLKEIISEIESYSGDIFTYVKALQHIENYYSSENDINSALEFSLKCCKAYHNSAYIKEYSQSCCDAAYYYKLKNDRDSQFLWLQRAVICINDIKLNKRDDIDQYILSHEKMLTFYEEYGDSEKQIQENKILENILASLNGTKYEKKLSKVYNNLSHIFFEMNNLTQAYFYKMLEEEIIQKSF